MSVQQVALCCVSLCVCVNVYVACGTVWRRFGGLCVQQESLWFVCECVSCVWYSLEQGCGIECAAGGFVLCLCVCVYVCAACGTIWSRFGGLSVQQVALMFVNVCVFECAACGTVWSRFGEVSVQHVAMWCVSVCV